jgi:hypothetical protein
VPGGNIDFEGSSGEWCNAQATAGFGRFQAGGDHLFGQRVKHALAAFEHDGVEGDVFGEQMRALAQASLSEREHLMAARDLAPATAAVKAAVDANKGFVRIVLRSHRSKN